jgi:hypothetical protein
MGSTSTAYEYYLNHDLGEYAGMWVAIINNSVVASDRKLEAVLKSVSNKYPKVEPFLTHVPKKGIIEML